MSGFAESFALYVMEIAAGGGSNQPEPDVTAEAVLYMLSGELELFISNDRHRLVAGSFAFVPPGTKWTVRNSGDDNEHAVFVWVRKRYVPVDGISRPESLVVHESDVTPRAFPGTEGSWSTTRFVDPDDLRHDMNVNIVSFSPGASIPFMETHVMEHGIYVLEGKAVYRLNRDWVEVKTGDFLWLRAFCPQACYAGGPGRFRYLLYKDVNRHPSLEIGYRS